jgi:Protein of unknown function (DUF3224)
MRRGRSPFALLVILLAAIAVSAVAASPALSQGSKKGARVSGEILLDPADNVAQEPTEEGAITVTQAQARVTFTGHLRGPAVEPYTNVQLPDGGPLLQTGTGTFTGKALGRTGTLAYVFSGDAANGGLITITGGTGGLRGATGRLAFYPSSATDDLVTFKYEGRLKLRRR